MNRTVYKVSFLPILAKNDKQETVRVGRWIVYAVAENPNRIGEVLRHFLPDLYDEGYEIEDSIVVAPGNNAWSVSVGPEGRSYSMIVEAPDEEHAERALIEATKAMPYAQKYVLMKVWTARLVTLDKEGVF